MALVGAAIGVVASWASTTLVPLLSGSLLGQMLSSVAFSALSRALQRATAKKQRPPGISTEYTTDGDTRPQSFMLGWSATGGHMICPPMSHGKRNAYLTYVIDLGNVPRHALVKLMINDEEVGFEAVVVDQPKDGPVPTDKPAWWYIQQGMNPANPEQGLARTSPGRPAKGDYAGKVWLRYYDGTQTEADPYLLQVYGAGTDWAENSERPWLPDMVGVGTCYAIVTFKSDPKLFGGGLPRCRFEMTGVPVYDPRKDSTVGGSGPQRAGNPTTWAPSGNAMLLAYNIFRGIPIPGGPFWGLGVPDADLPLSVWTPIFNTCEQVVDGQPRYQAGLEVAVDEEPLDVLAEILKVCAGQVAEVGGVWKARVGPTSAPVYMMTDDTIIASAPATFAPHRSLIDTYNGVHASYPDPASLWEAKDAPPRYNAAYEAADRGRRRVAELSMPACPWPLQVQRVMWSYLEEERRFRRHSLPLPPEALKLEPLDAISWSSAENGYDAKIFDLKGAREDLQTCLITVDLQESDPADYSWKPDFVLPTNPPSSKPSRPVLPPPQYFSAEGIALPDANGQPRRPAARLRWGGWALDGVAHVRWEIRLPENTDAMRGLTDDPAIGEAVTDAGMLPDTPYEARILFVDAKGVPSQWTLWKAFRTPPVYLGDSDFEGGIRKLFRDQGMSAIEYLAELPSTGNWPNRTVFLTTDGKLYRWNGSAWKAVVEDALRGVLDQTYFAAGIKFPKVVSSLPATGAEGDLVTLASDGLLYRRHEGQWTAGLPASLLNGQIIAAQIAVGAVGADQIAANALLARHFAVTDFTNYVGDDQIQDPASWSGVNAANVTHGPNYGTNVPAAQSRGVWSVTPGGPNATTILSRPVPAKPGEHFSASGRIGSTGSGFESYTLVQFLDMTNGVIGGSTFSPVKKTGVWETVEVPGAVAPAGTAYVAYGYHVPPNKYGGATIIFSAPELRRKFGGNAVIDGTLTGIKFVAETITGGLLAGAGIITKSAQFNAAVIDTLAVGGAQITAPAYSTGAVSGLTMTYVLTGPPGESFPVFILGTLVQTAYAYMYIKVNGQIVCQERPASGTLGVMSTVVTLPLGTHQIQCYSDDPANSNRTTIFAIAAKR